MDQNGNGMCVVEEPGRVQGMGGEGGDRLRGYIIILVLYLSGWCCKIWEYEKGPDNAGLSYK